LEATESSFPLRIELVFKQILRATFVLSWRYALLFQIDIFSWDEETYESLQRKLFVLEAAASSKLFHYDNRVIFGKEYFHPLRISKVQIGCDCSK
jgi:hypothetical protein